MKKKLIILVLIVVCGFGANAQKVIDNFIQRHVKEAQELREKWGIPASIILGVALHESGAGTSRNAKELNNYFGVKGSNNLTHRKSSYKAFESAKDAFNSFCSMISRKQYYQKLKGNMNPKKWLAAMNSAGYATIGQEWVDKINSIIYKQKLTTYDKVSGSAAVDILD